jgi:hypothetical protein
MNGFPSGCADVNSGKGERMDQHQTSTDHSVVRKVIFRTDVSASLVFFLVEYADGRLGILRNGVAIPHQPWHDSELGDCIDTFQHLAHQAMSSETDQFTPPLS